MQREERVRLLRDALSSNNIAPHYDEPFLEVVARIDTSGAAGKSDIAVLTFWKRLSASTRWVTSLLSMSESEVRGVTSRVVEQVRAAPTAQEAAQVGRDLLRPLPGFAGGGNALPSALLCAIDPSRLAVYDTRAEAALRLLEVEVPQGQRGVRDYYSRYIAAVDALRDDAAQEGHAWAARDVDIALFLLGAPGVGPQASRLTSHLEIPWNPQST